MGFMNAARAAVRRGWAFLQVYATDAINILRYAYLGSLIVMLIMVPILSALNLAHLARGLCFIVSIELSILGHIFDARLFLGATGYKWLRRIARMSTGGEIILKDSRGSQLIDERPYLSKIWYWSSFVNMWPPLVVTIIGIIGCGIPFLAYLALISGIFLILWAVATQLAVGRFWRRAHIATTVTILIYWFFVIYAPGWYVRILNDYVRTQNQSKIEELYQQTIDSTFTPQLKSVNAELVKVRYEMSQQVAAGRPIPDWQLRKEQNLENTRQYDLAQIDTYTQKINALGKKQSPFGLALLAFIGVLMLAGVAWSLEQLGAFTPSAPAGSH
jgi:hypothetical protein